MPFRPPRPIVGMCKRKVDPEGYSFPMVFHNFQMSPMGFNNLLSDGQSQTCSLVFRDEKWRKNFSPFVRAGDRSRALVY